VVKDFVIKLQAENAFDNLMRRKGFAIWKNVLNLFFFFCQKQHAFSGIQLFCLCFSSLWLWINFNINKLLIKHSLLEIKPV